MKKLRTYLLFFIVILALPLAAHADTTLLPANFQIFPTACNCPGSAAAWGCVLQVFQNLLKFVVALAVLVITTMLAWAGFEYMTSGGSAEKRSAANKRMVNAVLGLFIVLAAFLLVDSLMKVVYDPSTAKFGPWNSILTSGTGSNCLKVSPPLPSLPNLLGPSNPAGGTAPAGQTVPPSNGSIPSEVCSAASAYYLTKTSSGPSGGALACAWAVNNVLTNAGLSSIGGNSVSGMESALQGGRGTQVSQSSAVCGDIVVQAGDGHVGICLNAGCSQVISNSSSKASFSWISGPDFAPSYTGGIGRFYQINN